jgi:SAM-dependent methyltransferase
MQYDPVKRKLGKVFNSAPILRKLFYRLLDLLLLRSWHIRKAIKIWEKSAKGPQHILDAGSGFGQYDYYLAKRNRNWTIKAVDVKQEQIDDCNGFFKQIGLKNASFGFADLTKLDEKEKFDLAICVDVMEHIEEDEKVFSNFYKALKPGGMLLVSTPSDQGGSDVHHHDHEHDHYENEGTQSFIDEHVRDGYGVEDIKAKLKRAGFSKSEVYFQYGPSGNISWKLSMKYPITMLNKSYLFFILLPFYYLLTFPISLILNYLDVNGNHTTGTGIVAKAWK